MSTHHDPFENKLSALRRRELPAEWKAEILGAAASARKAPARTPRWLIAGWSAAWAATLALYFTTPAESAPPASSAQAPRSMSALQWEQRLAAIEDLLAAN